MSATEPIAARARLMSEAGYFDENSDEVVPSPCISVCRHDGRPQPLRGVLRTIDEIRAWAGRRQCTAARHLGQAACSVPGLTCPILVADSLCLLHAASGSAGAQPMKHITFYLDFVSPYAWVGVPAPARCAGGAELQRFLQTRAAGRVAAAARQPGPAGIAPKRDWTYRHVTWLGHAQGTPLQMLACHPFKPAAPLRQALGLQ